MSSQDARSFTQGPHAGRGPIGWTRTDARLAEAVSEALSEDRLLDARGQAVGSGYLEMTGYSGALRL